MNRKITVIFAGIFVLACIALSIYINQTSRMSADEAAILMEEYLVLRKSAGPGLVSYDDPQQTYVLESIVETNIYGKKAYCMDLIYGPGPMKGRLVFSCAVTTDGKHFYQYNQATGIWENMVQ